MVSLAVRLISFGISRRPCRKQGDGATRILNLSFGLLRYARNDNGKVIIDTVGDDPRLRNFINISLIFQNKRKIDE
jgi:hypothetical protein